MSFAFGFSGDDIEEDPNDITPQHQQEHTQPTDNAPPPIPARTHDLDELVSTYTFILPSDPAPSHRQFDGIHPRERMFKLNLHRTSSPPFPPNSPSPPYL
jgi:protein-histidine N-methyltransferase